MKWKERHWQSESELPDVARLEYVVVARDSHEPLIILCEPIDTEFLVVAEWQLANDRAQRHLRRFDVHFIQNLFHLHDDLAVAKNDDRVRALIGDELGVSDRDRFGARCPQAAWKVLPKYLIVLPPVARSRSALEMPPVVMISDRCRRLPRDCCAVAADRSCRLPPAPRQLARFRAWFRQRLNQALAERRQPKCISMGA